MNKERINVFVCNFITSAQAGVTGIFWHFWESRNYAAFIVGVFVVVILRNVRIKTRMRNDREKERKTERWR